MTHKFGSLSDLHEVLGLPAPLHPLITLINNVDAHVPLENLPNPHVLNFYKISYKVNFRGSFKYGQHFYDFNDGGMFFVSPNQFVGDHDRTKDHSCFSLLIHSDFLLPYPLSKKIKLYGFFSYSANEALYLSASERNVIMSVYKIIEHELNNNKDDFSQDVIISQIELLLNYSNRFYKRQFTTRQEVGNDLLRKLEEILNSYFNTEQTIKSGGIPTVAFLAEQLKLTPSYLSDMLRSLTGLNAQQHIHQKLIERAKYKLSTSQLTVAEIAYQLGFEHPQSFSKFFKLKTKLSPLKFRRTSN
ncbi:helix-turn-helix domain-containing protein [Dawidia cretensis]|nr:helix-turn-helix domain-containing protein [Dawidia cretensis]